MEERTFADILGNVKDRNNKGSYLHIGFNVEGDDARILRAALANAGIENIAGYVRGLVLADLKARLSKTG